MKLERFNKYKNIKNIVIVSFIFLIGLIAGVVLFNSFAYFEETKSFNIIEGRVPTINKGDVKIAVKVDGESVKEFPSKENHKYVEDENTCTNGASITWDNDKWELNLNSSTPTVCTLKFVSIKFQYTLDGGDPTDTLPVKKGHRYTGYECTGNGNLEWDKKDWTVTNVSYTETSVCTISFKTIIVPENATGIAKDLIDNGELEEITHGSTEQTGSNTNTDYRYQGENPNNYVNFNGEKWRIIGVFNTDDGTGNYNWRVKLIRATGLSSKMAWASNIVNDWSKASLNTYLNGTYYNSLISTAKNQISQVKWYLGGSSTYNLTSDQFFGYERGNTKGSGASAYEWSGNIGLMYPSDYGYSNANCINTKLGSYNGDCADGSWIYKSNYANNDTGAPSEAPDYSWTLTPGADFSIRVFSVYSDGSVGHTWGSGANASFVIRPVVFLNSNILVTGGDGQINSAYDIELPN